MISFINLSIKAGWGIHVGNKTSTKLLYAEIPSIPNDVCFETNLTHGYGSHFLQYISSPTSFCGGNPAELTGPCNGDSGKLNCYFEIERIIRKHSCLGGGFITKKGRIHSLQGIVSASLMDDNDLTVCDPHKYAIFTNVVHFTEWIREKARETWRYISIGCNFSENDK